MDHRVRTGKVPFVVAFIVGVVIIVLGSMMGSTPGAVTGEAVDGGNVATRFPWRVLVLLVGLMMGYASITAREEGHDGENWGDRCYYMGFLFTLVSMIVALYQYTGGTELGEIIPAFALALVTTVTGLLLRVIGDRSPTGDADMTAALLGEELERAAKKGQDALDKLASVVDRVQRDLGESGVVLANELRSGLLEPVGERLGELGSRVESVSTKVNAVCTALDQVSVRLRSGRGSSQQDHGESVTDGVDKFRAGLMRLTDQIQVSGSQIKEFGDGVARSKAVVIASSATHGEILAMCRDAHGSLLKSSEKIAEFNTGIGTTLQSWRDELTALAAAGKDQVEYATELRGVLNDIGAGVVASKEVVESLNRSIGRIQKAGRRWEGLVAAVEHVHAEQKKLVKEVAKTAQTVSAVGMVLGRELGTVRGDVDSALRAGAEHFAQALDRSLDGWAKRFQPRSVGTGEENGGWFGRLVRRMTR